MIYADDLGHNSREHIPNLTYIKTMQKWNNVFKLQEACLGKTCCGLDSRESSRTSDLRGGRSSKGWLNLYLLRFT